MVPTSLLTHMTLTTATPDASARSTAASSTTPNESTGRTTSSPPRCCTACAAASTALCSVAATATRNGPPRSRAARAEPITARLSASVPPEVKITWPGSTLSASAIVRFASSTPARAARPNRWAEDGFPKASFPRYGSIASSTSGRTGVVAALSRYTRRLAMGEGIYRLQGLHAKLQDILHFQRLVAKERLAVRAANERAVVGRLHADQLVQVLPRGIDLTGRFGPVELRSVAADRLHLHVEGRRDIHHECRFHRVFAIRERIQNLKGAVGVPRPAVFGEAGQVTGVAPQLGGDAMIGVPADGEGEDHDARARRPDELDHPGARRLVVLQVGIGELGVEPQVHAERLRRALRLRRPRAGVAARTRLALRQVEDADAAAGLRRLRQRAAARQLDVVAVRGDSQKVHLLVHPSPFPGFVPPIHISAPQPDPAPPPGWRARCRTPRRRGSRRGSPRRRSTAGRSSRSAAAT